MLDKVALVVVSMGSLNNPEKHQTQYDAWKWISEIKDNDLSFASVTFLPFNEDGLNKKLFFGPRNVIKNFPNLETSLICPEEVTHAENSDLDPHFLCEAAPDAPDQHYPPKRTPFVTLPASWWCAQKRSSHVMKLVGRFLRHNDWFLFINENTFVDVLQMSFLLQQSGFEFDVGGFVPDGELPYDGGAGILASKKAMHCAPLEKCAALAEPKGPWCWWHADWISAQCFTECAGKSSTAATAIEFANLRSLFMQYCVDSDEREVLYTFNELRPQMASFITEEMAIFQVSQIFGVPQNSSFEITDGVLPRANTQRQSRHWISCDYVSAERQKTLLEDIKETLARNRTESLPIASNIPTVAQLASKLDEHKVELSFYNKQKYKNFVKYVQSEMPLVRRTTSTALLDGDVQRELDKVADKQRTRLVKGPDAYKTYQKQFKESLRHQIAKRDKIRAKQQLQQKEAFLSQNDESVGAAVYSQGLKVYTSAARHSSTLFLSVLLGVLRGFS